MTKPVKRILTLGEQQQHQADARSWEWPQISAAAKAEADPAQPRTNAMGMVADWYQEEQSQAGAESQDEPLPPLTAADLEAIRLAAYEEGKQEGWQEGQQLGYQEGLEQGRQEGYEAGHQQGICAGHQQGLAQGQAEIEALAGNWKALLDALSSPLRQVDEQVEQQLIRMVLVLVRELVQVELVVNQAVIVQVLTLAINALPMATGQVCIQLHPDDLALVERAFPEAERDKRGWHLLAQPACGRGDVRLDCGDSSVEVLQEARLADLIRNFLLENHALPVNRSADE